MEYPVPKVIPHSAHSSPIPISSMNGSDLSRALSHDSVGRRPKPGPEVVAWIEEVVDVALAQGVDELLLRELQELQEMATLAVENRPR
jgi:hypothetical protein